MKFNSHDFLVQNISNIPNDRVKIDQLISIFMDNTYSLNELNLLEYYDVLGVKKETFRKIINHSTLLGILIKLDNKYSLSYETFEYIKQNCSFEDYIYRLVQNNSDIYKSITILTILLEVFSSLRTKTIYTIFSLIGKKRLDLSSEAAVGRNLRSILSIMQMLNIICKNNNVVTLKEKSNNLFNIPRLKPISIYFKEDVININLVNDYLMIIFDNDVSKKILSCVSTFEIRNYIWTKSSIYKNQGEIKNLHDEYIMTLMVNERR